MLIRSKHASYGGSDVHEFAVADEYQGKGIGKRIMEYIIGEAKQAGMNIALTAAPGESFTLSQKLENRVLLPSFTRSFFASMAIR